MKRLVILLIVSILCFIFVNAESIFLSDYMEEGETKVYETEDGVYAVSLLAVSDIQGKATFRLNSEMSKGIKRGDSYVFEDGSEIVVRDLILNEGGDGKDEAYYYFYGTGEGVLDLKNVSKYALEGLCNFDTQCLNETKEDCCYDCGCSNGGKCVNNKCIDVENEEEEVEEEVIEKEEVEEEVEEESKMSKEKKAAYSMLAIISILIIVTIWFVFKKKRRNIF